MRLPYKEGRVDLTSTYGKRSLNGCEEFHGGIDLVGRGSKEIVAVSDGLVVRSRVVSDRRDRTWEWGEYAAVSHADGTIAYYCHMSERKVKQGDRVREGDVIGIEGSTGKSTGSHLHFEVRKGNGQIDPAAYLGIENRCAALIAGADSAGADDAAVCRACVAARCGFEQQTIEYLNRYPYADDLWRKLCAAMR